MEVNVKCLMEHLTVLASLTLQGGFAKVFRKKNQIIINCSYFRRIFKTDRHYAYWIRATFSTGFKWRWLILELFYGKTTLYKAKYWVEILKFSLHRPSYRENLSRASIGCLHVFKKKLKHERPKIDRKTDKIDI